MFLTHLLTHISFQALMSGEHLPQRGHFSVTGTEVKHCTNIQEQTLNLGFHPSNLHELDITMIHSVDFFSSESKDEKMK